MAHRTWAEIKAARAKEPGAAEAYERAQRDYELGRRLRELREAAGVTQVELARRVGTGQSTIARIEAGGGTPKLDTLERIATALGAELIVDIKPGSAG